MVQYKFNYFNLRGRGELIRLIFVAAGEPFEDNRIERENWPTIKPYAPFGQVPFLEVKDGDNHFSLSQSVAIARFLARRFNLAGRNELEQAEADMFADQITDLTNEFVKAIFEKDENRKKDIQDRLGSEVIPNNLKIFESRLGKNNSGYLIGKSLTWTDLYLVSVLDWLGENKQPTLEHFPHLKAFDQQIRAIPSIAQWISKRPKTAM